jgi:hypothetical protein
MMTVRKHVSYVIVALMMVLVFVPVANGGLYWESIVETGGAPEGMLKNMPEQFKAQMMEQFKPKTEIVKNYLESSAMRSEQNDQIMIMNYDTMMMYQIDPLKKTYSEVNLQAAMEGMGQEMSQNVQIRATNETKKIAGYKCTKYIVTMMGADSEYWVSKDVDGYMEYKAAAQKLEKELKKSSGMGPMGMPVIASEEGFPVKIVTDVMGMKSTTTLKTMQKKSLSKSLFEIPKGYQRVEMHFTQ